MIDIKKLPKGLTISALFWNGMLLLALIVIALIGIEWAGLLYGVMSFLALGFLMDQSIMSEEEKNRNIWVYITGPYIAMFVLGMIGFGIFWVFDQTINRFNCYLNKKEFVSFFNKD